MAEAGPPLDASGPRRAEQRRACHALFEGGLPLSDSGDAPSFRQDLMRVFALHCNVGGCHLGEGTTGQLQLGEGCDFDLRTGTCGLDAALLSDLAPIAYANLLRQSNAAPNLHRVEPGDALHSFILLKLSGCQDSFPDVTGAASCGSMMPPITPLRESDPDLFAMIARWILLGAPLD